MKDAFTTHYPEHIETAKGIKRVKPFEGDLFRFPY